MSDIVKDIHNYCIANSSTEGQTKYARYFREGLYNGYGLSAALIYGGAKELSDRMSITLDDAMNAAPEIIINGKYDEISILMLIIKGMNKKYTRDTFHSMAGWYKIGINNWAHADTMGMLILPLFLKKDIIGIGDFSDWLTAQNKFQRRSVPVTFIKIIKNHGNIVELFNFIECLMTDPEREVHQGTGWFLREAWKRYPSETESFLLKWKEVSARLIFQYATEKMKKEDRVKFRRENRISKRKKL